MEVALGSGACTAKLARMLQLLLLSHLAVAALNFSLVLLGIPAFASAMDGASLETSKLAPSSSRALAEKDVNHSSQSEGGSPGSSSSADAIATAPQVNSGNPVLFPDFSRVQNEAVTDGGIKGVSKACHRAGYTYKPGDVMYASCKSQNNVDRTQPRASHGKFHGSNTGSDTGSF